MSRLKLLIKGTPDDALRAAERHGIKAAVDQENQSEGLTVVRCESAHRQSCDDWLEEVKRRPYPPGTLITYSASREDWR